MPSSQPAGSTSAPLGVNLVLLGSVFLALQNVILRVIFIPSPIFGLGSWGGWLEPGFANALLLLWLRTGFMALLLVAIAPRLHPATFSDLRRLGQQRSLLLWIILSGILLAIALSLLNLAISQVETGIAIGVFFTHPAWTVMLAWWVWGDRPPSSRLGLMVMILVGVMLTTFPAPGDDPSQFLLGSLIAIGAAIVYAAYSLTTQICLRPNADQRSNAASKDRLHPVPFSLVNFVVVVLVTSLGLLGIRSTEWSGAGLPFLLAGLGAAIAALLAYVLLNFGVSLVGAALANLISAVTPVLSALFAWIILHEVLRSWQWVGVMLVAMGVAALGVSMQKKS